MTDLDPSAACEVDARLARPSLSDDCPLDRLIESLGDALDGVDPSEVDGARVAALLREYASGRDSWRPYAAFGEQTYSRNLVWRSNDFELLLLCWRDGQASAIHDHADQNCWMAVLDGALEEEHFSARDGGLKRGRVMTYPAGGVAFIRDEIALHQIRPAAGSDGVSLHLYSRPLDRCLAFCPDTGEPEEVRMGYTSVRGTACPGVDPAAIRRSWTG